ncbi:hypothetical protein GGR51DRAFT_513990 [Nemania sp. FL0031]|nr:hypothetical protein GGR51DRAFT_513990 [Nemania sp. FL0031]
MRDEKTSNISSSIMALAEFEKDVAVVSGVGKVIAVEPDVYLTDGQQSTPDELAPMVAEDNLAEGQSSATANCQGAGSETDGNELGTSLGSKGAPHLYCPVNRRPHAILFEFGHERCHLCKQDLREPKLEIIGPADSSSKHAEKDTKAVPDQVDNSPSFSFTIEYTDKGGCTITSEPWGEKPFDLRTARGAIESNKPSVFEVITVLKTTIPEDVYRRRFDVKEIMAEGILDNPKIGVTVGGAKMMIKSPEIIRAIIDVVAYYPFVDLEGENITIEEPYPVIAHHMEQLERYTEGKQGDTAEKPSTQVNGSPAKLQSDTLTQTAEDSSSHLNLLLNYVKGSVYKDDIRDELARYGRGTCTFRMLWLLFKPGDTVYCETGDSLAAYVVSHVKTDASILSQTTRKDPYTVHMWSLDFDGVFVGRCAQETSIPQFEGERAITSLKVFPCEYRDRQDQGKTSERLEQQGKQWYQSIIGRQVYYSGRLPGSGNKSYHGRAFADNASYYAQYPFQAPKIGEIEDMGPGLPKCYCEECKGQRSHPPTGFRWANYDVLDPFKGEGLETDGSKEPRNHRYLLCNRRVWGLMLKTRTWESLDVANCSASKPNTRAIENLVMPEERKTMIKALVQKFTNDSAKSKSQRPWLADFMENKGEGQIFLLHGGPGVGKTFTAECIAEYTGRALLSLTGGDIGTDETKVEENLVRWFRLAEAWGAVMLIDEADVYLEKREFADLKRNSLVSVFLRCTEYYKGILFLTTNRVGHFDDAFMSRIHVVIAYENLKSDDRTKIWRQFFNKLSEDRQDVTVTSRAKRYVLEDETVTKLEWNGREIRNAFQTAVTLAEYRFQQKQDKEADDGPVVDQTDFEQVLDMTFQFKAYLDNVHGANAEERAYQSRSRVGPPE